ncbi:MAG: MBL fold metallo-hydrolase [Minisyncoccia bacterium]
MKLTILGSGTCILTKKRSAPSLLLEISAPGGKNKKMLFDCGPGTFMNLVKANVDWNNIDYFFITHFHADHLVDLMQLLQAIFVKMLFLPEEKREKPILLFGPPGFKKFISN